MKYPVAVGPSSDIDAVESVQRRATRILPELRGLDYEARLRSLKLPTLTYRRLRGDVINVYKYIHGIYRLITCLRWHSMEQLEVTLLNSINIRVALTSGNTFF